MTDHIERLIYDRMSVAGDGDHDLRSIFYVAKWIATAVGDPAAVFATSDVSVSESSVSGSVFVLTDSRLTVATLTGVKRVSAPGDAQSTVHVATRPLSTLRSVEIGGSPAKWEHAESLPADFTFVLRFDDASFTWPIEPRATMSTARINDLQAALACALAALDGAN